MLGDIHTKEYGYSEAWPMGRNFHFEIEKGC